MVGIWTGNPENRAIFPFEVCTIQAGQFYKKKVPSKFTDEVVKFATKSPEDRLATITGGIGHPSDPRSLKAPVCHPMSHERISFLTTMIGPRICEFSIYSAIRHACIHVPSGN